MRVPIHTQHSAENDGESLGWLDTELAPGLVNVPWYLPLPGDVFSFIGNDGMEHYRQVLHHYKKFDASRRLCAMEIICTQENGDPDYNDEDD